MAQLTVRLPDEMAEELESVAKRTRRKRADIVRSALRHFLEMDTETRVGDLLGSLESGLPDLAEDPRRYILESLQRGA